LNCKLAFKELRIRTGIHVVRTVVAIFPYLILERKSEAWSNTEGRPDGLLKRPNGCKLEQKLLNSMDGTDGNPSSGRMMLWSVGRSDGMARLQDGWNYGQMSVRKG
jgi:hypothetical protein